MDTHERLRLLRTHLGLTTRDFASLINMTGGAINNMEKGRRNITERTIKDICREYGVNRNWLITGTEPMFDDALEGLEVAEETRALSAAYQKLRSSDKELVRNLIDSLGEKKTPKEPPGLE